MIYIIFSSPKKIISHGLCGEKEKLIEEYYFRELDEESGITEEDIKYAHENVMKDKAVSWDLIPEK